MPADPRCGGRAAHPASAIGRFFEVPPLDRSKGLSAYSLVGLSLLYASAYFLPLVMPTGYYLLPSNDFLALVGWPSLVAVGVGIVVIYVLAVVVRRWVGPRTGSVLAIAALCVFATIALKCIAYAAGFDWLDQIANHGSLIGSRRTLKALVAVIVVVLLWIARGAMPKMTRAFASLGFAFLVLAAVRLMIVSHAPALGAHPRDAMAADALNSLPLAAAASSTKPRRVVWVIFDETDFDRVFGAQRNPEMRLPNFDRLAKTSVFASNANSPASATLFSIPALLTGTPIAGKGIKIDTYATLSLQRAQGGMLPFGEATSVFGAVSAGGRGVSILGFLHPYCKLFVTQRCESAHWPRVGAWDDGLLSNIPDLISTKLGHPDSWEAMTERTLQLLPEFLARDDALTFLHLDLPHLPSAYADRKLGLSPSADPLVSYSHNLLLTDQILGKIVSMLEQQAAHHELLLVVSTDHWLRKSWYRPQDRESSRPIPLMIWRVGETQGSVLAEPVSTVHVASMVVSFLKGDISTQADVATWWANKPYFPSFIAPGM
jgi:hypothetical protein